MVPGFLLRGQATIEPYAGNQGDGPSYGPPVTMPASIAGSKMIGGTSSADSRAGDRAAGVQYKVIMAAGVDIQPGYRLTVDGQQMTVRSVTNPGGPVGGHLEVVGDTRS
jgi:hypothetical protein